MAWLAESVLPDCKQKLARTGVSSAGSTKEGPLPNKIRTRALKKQCVLPVLRRPGQDTEHCYAHVPRWLAPGSPEAGGSMGLTILPAFMGVFASASLTSGPGVCLALFEGHLLLLQGHTHLPKAWRL